MREFGYPGFDGREWMRRNFEAMRKAERETQVTPAWISSFRALSKHFGNPETVCYPFSARDVSPSRAFPESRVMYVDTNPAAVDVLQGEGYEAYAVAADDFEPDRLLDLVILIKAHQVPFRLLEHVTVGGFVMCDDYGFKQLPSGEIAMSQAGPASMLARRPDYEPLGTFPIREVTSLLLDPDRPSSPMELSVFQKRTEP